MWVQDPILTKKLLQGFVSGLQDGVQTANGAQHEASLADDLPRWAALGGARSLADVLSRLGLLTWPLGLWGAALGERLYQTIATCKHFVG